jgi:excinuclease ABC subunit A
MEPPLTGEVLSRALSPLSRRCEMDARVNRPENSDFEADGGFVRVQGARENNLKDVSLDIAPQCACGVYRRLRIRKVVAGFRDALCGGTAPLPGIRLALCPATLSSNGGPGSGLGRGLPPAVALQQQRGSPTIRSSVGSVTTLSNLLRMLYSRAGEYPQGPRSHRRRNRGSDVSLPGSP